MTLLAAAAAAAGPLPGSELPVEDARVSVQRVELAAGQSIPLDPKEPPLIIPLGSCRLSQRGRGRRETLIYARKEQPIVTSAPGPETLKAQEACALLLIRSLGGVFPGDSPITAPQDAGKPGLDRF